MPAGANGLADGSSRNSTSRRAHRAWWRWTGFDNFTVAKAIFECFSYRFKLLSLIHRPLDFTSATDLNWLYRSHAGPQYAQSSKPAASLAYDQGWPHLWCLAWHALHVSDPGAPR